MKEFNFTITDPVGLHARPAGLLAKLVRESGSAVRISCNGSEADASKLIRLMSLGAKHGDLLSFRIDGGNEDATLKALREFCASKLGGGK